MLKIIQGSQHYSGMMCQVEHVGLCSIRVVAQVGSPHKKASNHHANLPLENVQFYIVTTSETPGNHWC